jgi:hypothetical protein
MVIEVPEELKDFGEAVLRVVTMVARGMTAGAGGKALDYARVEREVAAGVQAIERSAHRAILQRLDVDREYVSKRSANRVVT